MTINVETKWRGDSLPPGKSRQGLSQDYRRIDVFQVRQGLETFSLPTLMTTPPGLIIRELKIRQ